MNAVKRNGVDMFLIILAVGCFVVGGFLLSNKNFNFNDLFSKMKKDPVENTPTEPEFYIYGPGWTDQNGNVLKLNEDETFSFVDNQGNKLELIEPYDKYNYVEDEMIAFIDSSSTVPYIAMEVGEFSRLKLVLLFNDQVYEFTR